MLFDTNVWSRLVLGTGDRSRKVQADLAELLAKYPRATRATSAICVAECLVAARRLSDEHERAQAEAAFMAHFANPMLMVVDVTQPLLDHAATLRAEALRRAAGAGGGVAGADGGKLKLPDAIIAASCFDFDPHAILVTENVRDFQFEESGVWHGVAGLVVEKVG